MRNLIIYVLFIAETKYIISQILSSPSIRTRTRTGFEYKKNWCDFEIDAYSCLNVNCNQVKRLKIMPESIVELSKNFSIQKFGNERNKLVLCSFDLTESGITQIKEETFKNFDMLLLEIVRLNPNQANTNIKLFMSNLSEIREFGLPNYLNTVLFIRDSSISFVQPKSLSRSGKLELNLIAVNMSSMNWLHLLDSAKLKLLSLRNIPNLKEEFNNLNKEILVYPMASINDVKIYNTYLPIIDDNFFLFKVLKFIEQLELNSCSISFIKNSIFEKHSNSFRHLKYMSLMNNNLNKISDQAFNGLVNLISLDLDDNPIEYLHPNTFSALKKLRTLSVNSNTLKSMNVFNYNPAWIFSVLKANKHLQKLSFKTNQLLKNTCLLKTIIETINSINTNIVEIESNKSSRGETNHLTNNKKTVHLFSQDQLVFQFHNMPSLYDIHCNVYLACHLTKHQEAFQNYSIWNIEMLKSCPFMLEQPDNQKCLDEKRTENCDNTKSKILSDKNKKPSQFSLISSTSIYEMIIAFIAEYKSRFLIIGILICLVSIIIYLMFHFCCEKHSNQQKLVKSSYSKSSLSKNKNTNPAKYISNNNNNSNINNNNNNNKKRQTKPERKDMNVNLNHQNDYYVVLIEKD